MGTALRGLGIAMIACSIASASEALCDEHVRLRGGVGAGAGVGVVSMRSEYPLSFGVVAPFEGRLGVQFDRVFGAYAEGSLWMLGGQSFTTVVRGFASFVLLDHVELAMGPGVVGTGVFAPAFRVLGLAGERHGRNGRREGFAVGATVSPLIVDSHALWTIVGGLSYEVY